MKDKPLTLGPIDFEEAVDLLLRSRPIPPQEEISKRKSAQASEAKVKKADPGSTPKSA